MSTGGGRAGSFRSAMRSRDLRLLMASQLISASGSWAYVVALAVLLFDRTHSATWVAIGSLGRFVPALLLSVYGGVIAEKFERIRLMTLINIVAMVVQAGLAVAAWRHGSPGVLVALAALGAAVGTPYLPSVAAVIPQVSSEDDLAAANALSASVDNLVVVLGPAIGAVLVLGGGAILAIIVNAASFGVAAVIVSRMSVRSEPTDVTNGGQLGALRQMAEGLKVVASSTTVVVFVAFSTLASFVYGTDTVLFAPIATQQLHTGSSGYGYLLAGLGVGGVLGAGVVNRLAARPRLAGAILGGMALYTMPNVLLVYVHQPAVAFLIEVVRGAGTLVVDTLAITALQRSSPKEMVARVFGVFFALVLSAISIGALITPFLLRAGLDTALVVYGLGVPALCLVALPRLLSLDRVSAQRAVALAPRVAIIEQLNLFASASRASVEAMANAATQEEVPEGTPVVIEGDVADAFYVVVQGSLEVSATGEGGGAPQWLRTLGPGSYFGEIGLMAHVRRTASVTAGTDCTLLRISGDDFINALTNLSASPSLLEGAQSRLSVTHPSSTALSEGADDAPTQTPSNPSSEAT